PRRAARAAGGAAHGGSGAADVVHAVECPRGGAAAARGRGAWPTARGRGTAASRQRGSGVGPLRGAQLGGLAPSHDPVAVGAVVPDPGETPAGGEKSRR